MRFDLAFVLIDLEPWYKTAAAEMIRSARRAYQSDDMRIVHLTDSKSPHSPDADGVFTLDTEVTVDQMAQAKGHLMAEYALQADRPVIFCDVDIIWNTGYLAFTLEHLSHVGCLWRTDSCMPFNTGIVMTQPGENEFWETYRTACASLPKEIAFWWGDQIAMTAADSICGIVDRLDMASIVPSIKALPSKPLPNPAVHFKGDRKPLMSPYARLLDGGTGFEFVRPNLDAINIDVAMAADSAKLYVREGFTF